MSFSELYVSSGRQVSKRHRPNYSQMLYFVFCLWTSISAKHDLDIFEAPVTVTPQHEISKTLNSSKIPLKILNVYFWGKNVYFWGTSVYFWG